MSQLYGIDCSEFQGTIDWDKLNAASNFVMIRASFGTARKDYQFDRNQAEARRVRDAAGPLGIGYYYFAYPTLLAPQESADFFLDNLGIIQPGEVLALDLEGDIGANPVGWSLDFLRRVEQRTGVKALIYLNQAIMTGHNWQPVIDAGYGLWVADYDGNKTSVPPQGQWPVVAMKQWTDVDVVAGIISKVDGDTFYGDFATFAKYGYAAGTPAPPAPESPAPTPPAPTPPAQPLPPVAPPIQSDQTNPVNLPVPAPNPLPSQTPVVLPVPSAPQVNTPNDNTLPGEITHLVNTAIGQLTYSVLTTLATSAATWILTHSTLLATSVFSIGVFKDGLHLLLNLFNKNVKNGL